MPRPNRSIPKFGDWEAQSGVPYSILFETARIEKGKFSIASEEPEDGRTTRSPRTRKRTSIDSDHWRFSYENASTSNNHVMNEIMYGSRDQPIEMAKSQKAKHKLDSMQRNGHLDKPLHALHHERSHSIEKIQAKPSAVNKARTQILATDDNNTSVPKFGNWDVKGSTAKNYSVVFDRASREKKSRSGQNAALRNISSDCYNGILSTSAEGCKQSLIGWVSIFNSVCSVEKEESVLGNVSFSLCSRFMKPNALWMTCPENNQERPRS